MDSPLSRWSFSGRAAKGPEEFRKQLQQLGPLFTKIGQYLALRPDLLPRAYCDELMQLRERVAPFSWDEARAILREDLRADPAEIFPFVNPRPLTSGFLSQRYFAHTQDGSAVTIKIQHSDRRTNVLRQLERPRSLRRLLESNRVLLNASPTEIIEELGPLILSELDFSTELTNVAQLYELAADSPFEKIPRPYAHLSGPRVLTLQFLRGSIVSELLLESRVPSAAGARPSSLLPVDNECFAANLLTTTLTQVFRYQFFQRNLHPANLLVFPEDAVGFVDFGLCIKLDGMARRRELNLILALLADDPEKTFSALSETLITHPETSTNVLHKDFLTQIRLPVSGQRTNGHAQAVPGREAELSPISQGMLALLRAARRHAVPAAPGVASMYQALLAAEMVVQQLGTGLQLRLAGREFFARRPLEEALSALEPHNIDALTLDLLALWRDAPGQLHQILTELSDRRFVLNVNVSEAPMIARDRDRRVRLLVASILSVGVAILLARAELPDLFGISTAWTLSALLVILYIWIFTQWRRLR